MAAKILILCLGFAFILVSPGSSQECSDASKSCVYFHENNICERHKDRILTICRKSCGWCNEAGPIWGEWMKVGSCSVTCGKGSQTERRSCLNGNGCVGKPTRQVPCNMGNCPVSDCEDKFSACGNLYRSGYCEPSYRGVLIKFCRKTCGWCEGTTTVAVTTTPAPWNVSSQCTRTCGGGTSYRVPRCLTGNINACPKVYEDCNIQACSKTQCDVGEAHRYDDQSSCCTMYFNEKCGMPHLQVNPGRVVGGRVSSVSQWPWMVRIENRVSAGNAELCGGSLLDNLWIVTAGHCMHGRPIHQFTVTLGYQTMRAQTRGVRAYYVHPSYDFPKADIAVLKMTSPVQFTSYILPLCLPRGEVAPSGTICYAAGWGLNDQRRVSRTLLEVGLNKLPYDVCREAYKNQPEASKMSNKMLCAGRVRGGVDTCLGDSGGPLMCQRCSQCGWYLAGITSFGSSQCGIAGKPGVYTGLHAYEGWVLTNVSSTQRRQFSC